MTAIERLLEVAEAEIGYTAAESNGNMEDGTDSTGSKDYVKYARNLFSSDQAGPWCDLFVDWCFVAAFGKEAAAILLCDYFDPFITYSAIYYKERGLYFDKPQIGDVAFFKRDGQICHAGIVSEIDASTVYTIEGDTIPEPGVREEGVYKKPHRLVSNDIDGYMRPNWSMMPVGGMISDYDRQMVIDLKGNYYFSQKPNITGACREEVIGV